MKLKDAGIRAVRSLIQATIVAGGVYLAAAATTGKFEGFSSNLKVFLFSEALAAGYAVVSFLQNIIEDNTNVPTVK